LCTVGHPNFERIADVASRKQRSPKLFEVPASAQDAQVLTFGEWCKLNHISERTGRRILASPDSPVVTALSPRRLGITIANNRAWQASRARKVA
jgi:hypothetical protein